MGVESPAGAPEGLRWPRLTAEPRRPLRSLLPRGYAGYTEATTPRHLVLPASTAVPLVVKLVDSPYRPPQFIVGAHGTFSVPEGDCAPSYLEVFLGPLGAYTLLGLPMDQLSGQTAARLVRFDGVWRRLEQHKPLDWAGVARDAGYADQAHLIRDFREFTGTTPAELARRLPPAPAAPAGAG